jgi:hypothetical protein
MTRINLNTTYEAPYRFGIIEYTLIAAIIVVGGMLINSIM